MPFAGKIRSTFFILCKGQLGSVGPLFNEKTVSTDSITLIEDNVMVSDDAKLSEIFNEFFGTAVKSLNIPPYEPCLENITPSDDPVQNIIGKYKDHPSILKISSALSLQIFFSMMHSK